MARPRRKREVAAERRGAFRFPVTGDRSQGRLRVDHAEFAVTIVDESAGGFAVEFDGATDCRIGDCVLLRVEDEWIRVHVAFLDMQDVGVERFQGCKLSSHTRLGLMRSQDDVDWKLARGKRGSNSSRPPIAIMRSRALLAAAAGFIGGLVVFGAFGMRKLERAYSLNPMKNDQSEARVADLRAPLVLGPKVRLLKKNAEDALNSAADAVAPAAGGPGWTPAGSGRAGSATATEQTAEKARPLQQTISRPTGKKTAENVERKLEELAEEAAAEVPELPGKLWSDATVRLAQPAFLLRADIVERLNLTHAQQAQLRRLLVEHRTAGTSDSDELELLLGRRGLALLTTQQQYLLESIRRTQPAAKLQAAP